MKRIMFIVALLFTAALASTAADPVLNRFVDESVKTDAFSGVVGTVLSDQEMTGVSGELRIFGVRILPRLFRVDRRQRTSNTNEVHCDIIAQNRAEQMNLNTSNQDGSQTDYNQATVSQIYGNFPDNRASTPEPDTAGYFFTAYGSDMQHMGAYSRQSGSETYTRHWNDSFTESTSSREPSYTPPGVTDQSFVALPEYGYADLYYR